jgi:hypothetical protein
LATISPSTTTELLTPAMRWPSIPLHV